MDFSFLQATFLAFIQGLTEFLPISSSAHLILPAEILDWRDQGLAFDVAVHFGTLMAVIFYFRLTLWNICQGFMQQLKHQQVNEDAHLGWMLIIGSIPVVLAGLFLKDVVDQYFRSALVIASTTVLFGLLLWLADWWERKNPVLVSFSTLTARKALIIGLAQVLALVPGTSRSGITMTAGLFCQLDRQAASRFSFLLSIPAISGAALLLLLDLVAQGNVEWGILLYAFMLSAIVAYLCIHFFLKLINRMGFLPFVIYRLLLGGILFLFFL